MEDLKFNFVTQGSLQHVGRVSQGKLGLAEDSPLRST